jgi:hypothetical protein
MGAVCGAAACACACCSTLNSCCKKGKTSATTAKVLYLLFIVVACVTAVLLRFYGTHLFVDFYAFKWGCVGDDVEKCSGIYAVYRISFALTAFFLIMIFTSASSEFAMNYWFLKTSIFLALIVGSFFIPNQMFETYASIARVVSVCFLVLQILILLDFAYGMHELLGNKIEQADAAIEHEGREGGCCTNKWRSWYAVSALGMLLVGFGGVIAMFVFTTHAEDVCSADNAFISLTLIFGLIYTIAAPMESLNPPNGRGLLPPAVVFVYSVWLCWSSLTSNPDTGCNPLGSKGDESTFNLVVGTLFSSCSLAYCSWSASQAYPVLFEGGDKDPASQPMLDDDATTEAVLSGEVGAKGKKPDAHDAAERGESSEDEDSPSPSESDGGRVKWWFFMLIMLMGSVYMSMLLTDWAPSSGGEMKSSLSMWVKILAAWGTNLLFFWSLIAQRCCPNRDFS